MLHSKRLDQLAIALSAICIVHCLALPLLIAALPIVAVAAGTGTHFHALMLWLVVPTSVVGLGLGYRIHNRADIILIGLIGLTGVTIAGVWGHDAWAFAVESAVSVAASLVLGYAHFRNFLEVRRRHRHQ